MLSLANKYIHSNSAATARRVDLSIAARADQTFAISTLVPPASSIANSIAYMTGLDGQNNPIGASAANLICDSYGYLLSDVIFNRAVVFGNRLAVQTLDVTGATASLDFGAANIFKIAHASNAVVSFSNGLANNSSPFYIIREKDGTATERTFTWPAGTLFEGGVQPILTQSTNAIDVLVGRIDHTGAMRLRQAIPAYVDSAGRIRVPKNSFLGKNMRISPNPPRKINPRANNRALVSGAILTGQSSTVAAATDVIWDDATGTFTSNVQLIENDFVGVSYTVQTLTADSPGVYSIDVEASNEWNLTQNEDITSLTVTNINPSQSYDIIINRVKDATSTPRTIDFSNFESSGTIALTQLPSAIDEIVLTVANGRSLAASFVNFSEAT